MRNAPPEVIALLNSRKPYVFADCFTITLTNGTIVRYTNSQDNVRITPPGELTSQTFIGNQLLIDGMRMSSKRGLDVDEQDVTIYANLGMTLNGQPWMKALRIGFLDGATVKRDRTYAYSWEEPWVGAITYFQGLVSTCDPIGGQKAIMKVKSSLIVLDQEMPRNFFQTGCKHTLFDQGCGLDKNSFATVGLVEASSTAQLIKWTPSTAGTYTLGTITMETGDNVGISRTIRESKNGELILVFPFETPVQTGDQFKVYPGCDLTKETCETKFNNLDNFRGFPFVPPTATSY